MTNPKILKYSALAASACGSSAQAVVMVTNYNLSYNEGSQFLSLDVNGGQASVTNFGPGPPGSPISSTAELIFEDGFVLSGDVDGGNDGLTAYSSDPQDGKKVGKAFTTSNKVGDGKFDVPSFYGFDVAMTPNGNPNNEVIVGFAFFPEGSMEPAPSFGWASLTGVGTGTATLHQVRWETDPGRLIHVVPEASSGLLLLAGGAVTAFRRRRKTA